MTDRQAVVETIVNHLRETLPETRTGHLGEDQDLRAFAGFDSLGILELLVWLESRFAITIPDEELVVDRFDSVGKMTDYVLKNSA